ncbi:MAG: DUF11 domain-containing protein [Saprospiraceae bacterium]
MNYYLFSEIKSPFSDVYQKLNWCKSLMLIILFVFISPSKIDAQVNPGSLSDDFEHSNFIYDATGSGCFSWIENSFNNTWYWNNGNNAKILSTGGSRWASLRSGGFITAKSDLSTATGTTVTLDFDVKQTSNNTGNIELYLTSSFVENSTASYDLIATYDVGQNMSQHISITIPNQYLTADFGIAFKGPTSGEYGFVDNLVIDAPMGCPPVPEICDNNMDDDGDGLVDCMDPDCSSFYLCNPNIVIYKDDFSTGDYSGNQSTPAPCTVWEGDWTEDNFTTGGSGAEANNPPPWSGGEIYLNAAGQLEFEDDGAYIFRAADLSGSTSAFLMFELSSNNNLESGDDFNVSFNQVPTSINSPYDFRVSDDPTASPYMVPIPMGDLLAGFKVYFWVDAQGSNERYFLDNVKIVTDKEGPCITDVAVTKTVSPTSVQQGQNTIFTITAVSMGANTGVVICDPLPPCAKFVSANPSVGTFDGSNWMVGDMTAGQSATLDITVQALGVPGDCENIATYTGEDGDLTNNADTVSFTITPGVLPDVCLEISKTATPTVAAPGDNVTIVTTLENKGTTEGTNVVVKDLVPAGMTLDNFIPSVGTYNSTTGLWTVPSIAVGTTETLTLNLIVQ